jgi:competence protein ComEC
VIDAFPPPFVLDNGVAHTTLTYERYLDAVERSGAALLEPTARTLTLGDVRLHVLPSPRESAWGHNDNSVGIVVEYGAVPRQPDRRRRTAPLRVVDRHRPGAAPRRARPQGLAPRQRQRRHDEALARLRPEVVVASVGAGNPYGHPDPATSPCTSAHGATLYRTDHHGTVVIRAAPDGSFTVTTERADGAPAPAATATDAARRYGRRRWSRGLRSRTGYRRILTSVVHPWR